MKKDIVFRDAFPGDALRLSILYKQVYIYTYEIDGVTTEYANFIDVLFAPEKTIKQWWIVFFQRETLNRNR